MIEAMEELDEVGISCGGMNINNLRFADDIDLVGKDQREVQELANRLSNTSNKFDREISREKR